MGIVDHLESLGYEVLEAASGDQAIKLLSEQNQIDVLVTDIHMPGEVDGIELALGTRDNRPSARIIVVSGAQTDAPGLNLLGEEGRIFSKPFSTESLADRIRELLADAD